MVIWGLDDLDYFGLVYFIFIAAKKIKEIIVFLQAQQVGEITVPVTKEDSTVCFII